MENKAIPILGHTLFWLINYWLVAIGSDFNWNGFTVDDGSLTYAYIYGLFFNAFMFYIQVFWLYPKFYKPKKKRVFYVLTITSIIGISFLESYVDTIAYTYFSIDKPFSCGLISSFLVHITYTTAGFYYALKIAFKKSEILKRKLIEETYKTELKYLKAQLNPHFLFNGINNVYHLIGKDDDLAKETLHQFSDLLRYQLYESNAHTLLEKELDYISKYIKIEETRRGEDIQLDYEIKLQNPKLKIAPLLLIPFVENAFKHCSNHMDRTENKILITLKEVEKVLTLNIINDFDSNDTSIKAGGIGLKNVKKRLSILYKDLHQLEIYKKENKHIINLSINLQ